LAANTAGPSAMITSTLGRELRGQLWQSVKYAVSVALH